MFCTNCGKEIVENHKFCPYCGQKNRFAAKAADPSASDVSAESSFAGEFVHTSAEMIEHKEINDVHAWMLAVVPLLILIISYVVWGYSLSFLLVSAAATVATIIAWVLDMDAVDAAGYSAKGWSWTGFVCTPAYLFIRASKTNKKYGYAIMWCVLLLTYIVIVSISGKMFVVFR